MSNRIDIESIEARMRLWAIGDVSDEDLALELDYIVPELKRCYEELDRPKVTIDDWDKAGPCVTVYLEGKQYVGILREYDASE